MPPPVSSIEVQALNMSERLISGQMPTPAELTALRDSLPADTSTLSSGAIQQLGALRFQLDAQTRLPPSAARSPTIFGQMRDLEVNIARLNIAAQERILMNRVMDGGLAGLSDISTAVRRFADNPSLETAGKIGNDTIEGIGNALTAPTAGRTGRLLAVGAALTAGFLIVKRLFSSVTGAVGSGLSNVTSGGFWAGLLGGTVIGRYLFPSTGTGTAPLTPEEVKKKAEADKIAKEEQELVKKNTDAINALPAGDPIDFNDARMGGSTPTNGVNVLDLGNRNIMFGARRVRVSRETIAGYEYNVFHVGTPSRRFRVSSNVTAPVWMGGGTSNVNLGRILTGGRRVVAGTPPRTFLGTTADFSRRNTAAPPAGEGGAMGSNSILAMIAALGPQSAFIETSQFETILATLEGLPVGTATHTMNVTQYQPLPPAPLPAPAPAATDITIGGARYTQKIEPMKFDVV